MFLQCLVLRPPSGQKPVTIVGRRLSLRFPRPLALRPHSISVSEKNFL